MTIVPSPHDEYLASPHALWHHWHADAYVLGGLTALVLLYLAGSRALRRRTVRKRVLRGRHEAAFAGGVITLLAAMVSPIEAAAGVLFSAHMVQHLLLTVVAAPLLAVSRIDLAALVAVPPRWRKGVAARTRLDVRASLVAAALASGALWLWHVPLFYDLALRYDVVHAIEHASFLGTGLLFWWTLLHETGRRSGGLRLLALAIMAIQGGLLGALLLFAARPLYAGHAAIPSSWGLTPLADQQIAGLLMWVPPGLLYLSLASVVFVRWMAAFERVRHA